MLLPLLLALPFDESDDVVVVLLRLRLFFDAACAAARLAGLSKVVYEVTEDALVSDPLVFADGEEATELRDPDLLSPGACGLLVLLLLTLPLSDSFREFGVAW